MSDLAPLELTSTALPEPKASRARAALLKRLADVVCLPGSRVNVFERAVTADLLVEMLREAELDERIRVSNRLSALAEIPSALTRLLLRDSFEVAGPLLEVCQTLNDAELLDCARRAGLAHRCAIAQRRSVSEVVSDYLVDRMEPQVIDALLRNQHARLSADAVEQLVAASRDDARIRPRAGPSCKGSPSRAR
jgi:uncharacterized protein (DUF2336 family)